MCSLHIHKPALIVHGYQSVEPVGCAVWSPHAFLRHYAWPGGNSTTTCPAVLASSGDLPYKEPARPPQVGVNHIPTWAYVTGLPEASAGLRRGRHTNTEYTQRVKSISRLHERGVLDRAQRHYRAFLLGFLERGVPDRAEALSRSDPPPYSSFRPFDIKSCHGAEQRHAAPTIIVMSIDPPPRSHHSPAQLSRSHPVWDRTASWTFSALSRARLRWTSSAQVVVRVITYSGAR